MSNVQIAKQLPTTPNGMKKPGIIRFSKCDGVISSQHPNRN